MFWDVSRMRILQQGYLRRSLLVHLQFWRPNKLRLAFVGYGTADTVPSPIITKRFFIENPLLLKEALEFPHNLGIGTTSSGGSRGMAILDGLVAVLEVRTDIFEVPTLSRRVIYRSYLTVWPIFPTQKWRAVISFISVLVMQIILTNRVTTIISWWMILLGNLCRVKWRR